MKNVIYAAKVKSEGREFKYVGATACEFKLGACVPFVLLLLLNEALAQFSLKNSLLINWLSWLPKF